MDAAVLVGGVPVGVEFSVVADEVERERLVGTRGVGLGVHHLKRARQKPGAVVVVVAARTCQQAGREQPTGYSGISWNRHLLVILDRYVAQPVRGVGHDRRLAVGSRSGWRSADEC